MEDKENGKTNQKDQDDVNVFNSYQSPSQALEERLQKLKKWQEQHCELIQKHCNNSMKVNAVPKREYLQTSDTTSEFVMNNSRDASHRDGAIIVDTPKKSKEQQREGSNSPPSSSIVHEHTSDVIRKVDDSGELSLKGKPRLITQNFCLGTSELSSTKSLKNPELVETCQLISKESLAFEDEEGAEEHQEENVVSIPNKALNDQVKSCLSLDNLLNVDKSDPFSDVYEKCKGSAGYKSLKYSQNVPESVTKVRDFPQISQKALELKSTEFAAPTYGKLLESLEMGQSKEPKPKFKFLRKGQGTARYNMKPVKLKKFKSLMHQDIHANDGDFPEELVNKGSPLIYISVEGTPFKNTSKTSTTKLSSKRPIAKLQLFKQNSSGAHSNGRDVPQSAGDNLKSNHSVVSKACNLEAHLQDEKMLCVVGTTSKVIPHNPCYDTSVCREKEALSAFEKLEELAEDSSFSSNSSTVLKLLKCGQRSGSSTPVRSTSSTPQCTPVRNITVDNRGNEPQKVGGASSNVSLVDRMIEIGSALGDQSGNEQYNRSLNVNHILDELRKIVKLENADHVDISREECESILQSFISQHYSLPIDLPESPIDFLPTKQMSSAFPTSTPANPVLPQTRPHVRFQNDGVEVFEYEHSESEEETTLTDAPSIADDTDLVTTSDLETLTNLNIFEPLKDVYNSHGTSTATKIKQQVEDVNDNVATSVVINNNVAKDLARKESRKQLVQPVSLQFSPPPQRPQDSASHYIWSIFGKERDTGKPGSSAKSSMQSQRDPVKPRQDPALKSKKSNIVKQDKKDIDSDEIESYKTLMLAKMLELEKETETFRKENSNIKSLQQSLQEEKKVLQEERQKLQDNYENDKRNFQEYIDKERNKLWKEKQKLEQEAPSLSVTREQSLEMVYLKEQLQDLQAEGKKKEALHEFATKKLNEKLKILQKENTQLKEKYASLLKENVELKHKLDRTKLGGKQKADNRLRNREHEKSRPKATTVHNLSKSLVRVKSSDPLNIRTENDTKQMAVITALNLNIQNKAHIEGFSADLHGELNEEITIRNTNLQTNSSESVANDFHTGTQKSETDGDVAHHQNLNSVRNVDENVQPRSYNLEKETLSASSKHQDDYTEHERADGTKELIYANGNKKEIYPNGVVIVHFYNGDRKEVHENRTVYVYGTDQTMHTTYTDGKEVLKFPSGQKEVRYPDGSSEIVFTDNSRKTISGDGLETVVTKDGTVIRTNLDGSKVYEFVSGQKEIHTKLEKRREYPDGTVKILHQDGRTETRYNTGRTRIKDSEGNIIVDTHRRSAK